MTTSKFWKGNYGNIVEVGLKLGSSNQEGKRGKMRS